MFISPKTLAQNTLLSIQRDLFQHCKSRPSLEVNFIYDHQNEIACFLNSRSQAYTGYFFVTDNQFVPKIIYQTTAFINACAISDSGRYAICQTANNPAHDEDSGAFILLDVRHKAVLGKFRPQTGWKGLTGLFIDENNYTFRVSYGAYWVECDFRGQEKGKSPISLPEKSSRDMTAYLKTSLSPYQLNTDAAQLVKELESRYTFETEEKATILLNAAELHPSMSKYQLSLTHKALGDVDYQNSLYGSALAHYTAALNYNPKLGVKRRVKELQSIPAEGRKFSCAPDLIANVLEFQEYARYAAELKTQSRRSRTAGSTTEFDHSKRNSRVRQELADAAQRENNVYDPSLDAEIVARLDALGQTVKAEFYRTMEKRRLTYRSDDTLSMRDYALLTLKAMESSSK